jgi:hypothetical protein
MRAKSTHLHKSDVSRRLEEIPFTSEIDYSSAIVFILMGPLVTAPDFYYAIKSLRYQGGYEGKIFVLTDRPLCLQEFTSKHNVIPLEVKTDPITMFDMVRNPLTYRTRMRAVKTKILAIVPKEIEYVLYMDSDIMTVTKGCAKNYVRRNILGSSTHQESWAHNPQQWKEKTVLKSRWPADYVIHAGFFMIRRGASEALLEEWHRQFGPREALDRPPLVRALNKLYQVGAEKQKNTTMLAYRSQFVAPFVPAADEDTFPTDFMLPDNLHVLPNDTLPFCFAHISVTRCRKYTYAYIDGILGPRVPDYKNDLCRTQKKGTFVDQKLSRAALVHAKKCTAETEKGSFDFDISNLFLPAIFIIVVCVMARRCVIGKKRERAESGLAEV